MKRIYFDWASSAPASSAALRAFTRTSSAFGNPSSPHGEGRAAKEVLEAARKTIARHLGAKPEAVIFTSGATEANNLAIRGHVKALRESGRTPSDIHLMYLPSAHASTVEVMEALKEEGFYVEPLPLTDGKIDLPKLKGMVKETTALVSVDVVCGETGTRFDTRGLRHALDAASPKKKILMLADASQAPLVESVERTRSMADFITLDAAKVGGVRGLGVLLAPAPLALAPIMEGGGQERSVRSGTQTPALAAAFAAALEEAAKKREIFSQKAEALRGRFLEKLSKDIPSLHINGTNQAPHIINISLPGLDTEYLAALLDEEGIAVSTRSACETDSAVSRAVRALSGDEERARHTLRISFGPMVKESDFARLHAALVKNIQFLAANP